MNKVLLGEYYYSSSCEMQQDVITSKLIRFEKGRISFRLSKFIDEKGSLYGNKMGTLVLSQWHPWEKRQLGCGFLNLAVIAKEVSRMIRPSPLPKFYMLLANLVHEQKPETNPAEIYRKRQPHRTRY